MAREKATLAVLFADVSDSTQLYEKMGDSTAFGHVKDCLQILTAAATQFNGWVIKTIGDGAMCAFPDADSAARAACEMQVRVAQRPAPVGKSRITIRIGFHYGNVLREGLDVYGDTVNIAARIASLAMAGRITMTAAAAGHLSPALKSRVRKLSALQVKGKARAIDVHELIWQEGGFQTHVSSRAGSFSKLIQPQLHIEYRNRSHVFRDTVTLGRDDANDIVIEDSTASRHHARIEKRNDKFVLIDQSSNGTYVIITGREEIALRREEFILYGDGKIAFGDSPRARPDVATVRFLCELADTK